MQFETVVTIKRGKTTNLKIKSTQVYCNNSQRFVSNQIFENIAIGHVTDIPTVSFMNKIFPAARTVSSQLPNSRL